jgi:integration host factor beta subunit
MTKSDLIDTVAERLPHLTRKDAAIIINTIFDGMTDALANGERIEIRGFGSFRVNQRGEREGRNPRTGETVQIPAKRLPSFKTGRELHERINQNRP